MKRRPYFGLLASLRPGEAPLFPASRGDIMRPVDETNVVGLRGTLKNRRLSGHQEVAAEHLTSRFLKTAGRSERSGTSNRLSKRGIILVTGSDANRLAQIGSQPSHLRLIVPPASSGGAKSQ